MTIGIYKIINIKTGQEYVGQSINIEKRIKEHNNGKHIDKQYIDMAIKKYGSNSFTYKILESFDEYDKEKLDEREKYWIAEGDTFGNPFHYNLTPGGDGFCAGKNHPRYLSNLDNKKIYDMYVNQKKSTREIALEIGGSRTTIANHLRNMNVQLRDGYDDLDDIIFDMYVNQKKSIENIALELGIHYQTVSRHLKKLSVNVRGNNRNDIPSSKELLDEYLSNNISRKELAKKYNCHVSTIDRKLKEAKEAIV